MSNPNDPNDLDGPDGPDEVVEPLVDDSIESELEEEAREEGIAPVALRPSTSIWSRLYHGETNVDIVGRWKLWFSLSAAVIVAGLIALAINGLNFGIDFTGGTVWEVPAGKASVTDVSDAMAELGYDDVQVQEVTIAGEEGAGRAFRVEAEATVATEDATVQALDDADAGLRELAADQEGASRTRINRVRSQLDGIEGPFPEAVPEQLAALQQQIDDLPDGLERAKDDENYIITKTQAMLDEVEALAQAEQDYREEVGRDVSSKLAELTGSDVSEVAVDTVGPSWGEQISQKAQTALVVFLLAILAYITLRFEFRMAVATVVALIHDLLVVVGVYAIFQFPVTPATVIAVLTILGFSIYDGIVVFDRVDENTALLGRKSKMTYAEMANMSLNQVLMRSLNTSITALLPILAVLVLGAFVLGAATLEEFGLALFLGLLSGAYSSLFIATPLLAVLKEREPRYRELRERLANRSPSSGSPDLVAASVEGGAPSATRADVDVTPRPRKSGKKR